MKLVIRKVKAGLITLVLTLAIFGFVLALFLEGDVELVFFPLLHVYFVGIFCGALLSLGVDYILKDSKHRFILGLFLHILIVIVVVSIFGGDEYFWRALFIAFLPVGLCFFLIDEFLRQKQLKGKNT